jgi:hypothetical protein
MSGRVAFATVLAGTAAERQVALDVAQAALIRVGRPDNRTGRPGPCDPLRRPTAP